VTGENNSYGVATDFTNSCGLIFHRDAAGVVEAIGPSVQTTGADTKVIYQGDVIVGRLAYGCGAVRVGVAGAFRNV
jgi:NADPH:quinone reductase-like Zn-dependent oxidoreductase